MRIKLYLSAQIATSRLLQPSEAVRQNLAKTLAALMKKYEAAAEEGAYPRLPKSIAVQTQMLERNPIVVSITNLRANRLCEIPGCSTPRFAMDNGDLFCEVHHIEPLAEGGEDTIENAICLCPVHHRETHHGSRSRRAELREIMKAVRLNGAATIAI